MNEIKAILNIPWLTGEDTYSPNARLVTGEADSYAVPLIYRALRMRCNSLTRVPVYVYADGQEEPLEIEDYAFHSQMPLRELLWMSEASALLRGATWLLKLKNRYRYGKGLQWLNPFTMHYKYQDGELLFWQQLGGENSNGERFPKQGYWTVDDFVYIREFNPLDDLGVGVSAAQVALKSAQGSHGVSQFLSTFFPDAIPATMVMLPENTQEEERNRVEIWFKRKLSTLKTKFSQGDRILGVKGDVKTETLTAPLNTFDFTAIDKHVLEQVAHAFEMPVTMLSAASANYATAQIERRIYTEDTLIPRCRMYEQHLNEFLESVGQRIEFCPEELPEMQEDETTRAASLKTLVDAGMPLRAAIDILGYDLSETAEAELDKAEKEKEATPTPQPPTTPDNAPQSNGNAPTSEDVTQDDEEDTPTMPGAAKSDLEKWERKALKRLRAGKSPVVEFDSEVLSEEIKAKVLEAVKQARDEKEVKEIFRDPMNFTLHVHNTQPNVEMKSEPVTINVPASVTNIEHTINVPEMKSQPIEVNVPAPVVNVEAAQIQNTVNVPEIKVDVPQTVVNVEKPEPITVNVTNEVKTPNVVNVIQRPPLSAKVTRDAQGRIKGIDGE